MKIIQFTLTVPCDNDVPQPILEEMALTLLDHAHDKFRDNYDLDFVRGYEGPPIMKNGNSQIGFRDVTLAS